MRIRPVCWELIWPLSRRPTRVLDDGIVWEHIPRLANYPNPCLSAVSQSDRERGSENWGQSSLLTQTGCFCWNAQHGSTAAHPIRGSYLSSDEPGRSAGRDFLSSPNLGGHRRALPSNGQDA